MELREDLIKDMYENQLKNITRSGMYGRMNGNDIHRMAMCFDKHLWEVRNECIYPSSSKFSYDRQKVLFHRLLYHNYIGSLDDVKSVRHICGNKQCCTIAHLTADKDT
uniref:HNH nuclease domain-containing protein n=1 Tax=viral metagenome TaxID=1070528 RepID=A0A6C0CMN1_9ZZZZ